MTRQTRREVADLLGQIFAGAIIAIVVAGMIWAVSVAVPIAVH